MNRWRLNRGGIVNIWQYAEQEFDFSGGRVIFQGTNGSGKSRTLELLLPLCLDGELRQMGSKGFDTVSIRRLMLDDYQGGPNRIGYAWIELVRSDDAGQDEYLTCGIGVKASKTSQQVSDSWRFITPCRVGKDVLLVGADRVPVGPGQLRELLGADAVLEEAGFRARIAESVYGVPADRYGDLLHLQRTLRNPDVGLKVLEGQLEQILSDALPPLEAGLIERLATSFDDLESIRENIVRLSTADGALRTFLTAYSGYALAALRTAADGVRAAHDTLQRLLAELSRLERRKATAQQERTAADAGVAALEEAESELAMRIEALKALPAYQGMRDLADREKLVANTRRSAETALEVASRQRAQEDRGVDSVLSVLDRLGRDTAAAQDLADRAGQLLHTAGLDRGLCPVVPTVPPAEVTETTEQVRAKPEATAAALAVTRRAVPELDPEELLDGLSTAAAQAAEAATEVRQRGALTLMLHQRALESDRALRKVEELHRNAKDAQIGATDSAGRRNQTAQELREHAEHWANQVREWAEAAPEGGAEADRPAPPQPESLVIDRAGARAVREEFRQWGTPHQQSATQRVLAADQACATVREGIRERETELAALRRGQERAPELPAGERPADLGESCYRLVDFAEGLAEAERAGLEAAMQASGLLTAWVRADGTLAKAGAAEVVAGVLHTPADLAAAVAALPPVTGRSLAEALTAAAEPDSPVPADLVSGLLSAIALAAPGEDLPATALALSTDGRWRAGVLSGSATKEAAEHIGAGAREAARQRRILGLEDELEQRRGELATAQQHLEALRRQATGWEKHLAAFPHDDELIAAHARLAGAKESAEESEHRALTLREEHSHAEDHWRAVQSELTHAATEAGLSADTAALEQAHRAAEQVRGTVDSLKEALTERCAGSIRQLADALHNHRVALGDREQAEAQAESRCAEYAEQAAALAELTSAIGGEAKQVAESLATLEAEHKRAKTDLPGARERVAEVREEATKIATLLETKQQQRTGRQQEVSTAEAAFRDTLAAPGVWSAALPEAEAPDTENLLATAERLGAAEDRRPASEGTVIGRLQALQSALAGSHNITAETTAGILTVTVTSEDGPRPVADAAALVATRLGDQRGYLGERYQEIFSDYLMRDLAERLRSQIAVAEDLCRRMNEVLDRARSSQGVHVQLEWRPSAALDEATRDALELVRTPFAQRSQDQDATLRRAFTERIEAERDAHSAGYAEILGRALDYRSWYSFTVRVRDTGPDSKPRVRRLRQLSSGETRLVSYVTLFAAAASFYDAVSAGEEGWFPLRLVLLDEAFERLDDPTIARMLGLLVDLDMDWIITWPSGWGVSGKIPRMHIYDVLRPKNGGGVACTHTTWDGAGLDREDV
ncbi:TIGR02680 family protein [Crossiella cryophila]|uniref:Uncharacterized protein (TIGR02680 family) n=1 Tax=Crossiella cryophila TaxID=43355 RepID=A0A7W7C8L0_9PSEU|nr:TIGR02680 family protein [Crossiella cryophila]MBB4676559.1 uncharacterized protein (TIGR02680 family) [Crossiella cryophila]